MTRRDFPLAIASVAMTARPLAAEEARTILAKAAELYPSLHSYSFEGTAITEITIKGKVSQTALNFTVAYQEPDKFRLEFRYPNAGNWLRVSDGLFLLEIRTVTKESSRTPVTPYTIRALNSSPIANFQRLFKTAENPKVLRADAIEIAGRKIPCDVIQFTSHRRELRDNESPGPSLVWIAKDTGIVLGEEIRTSASMKGETSESKRTTSIVSFQINEGISHEVFSTKLPRK